MATNLDIDDELIQEVLRLSGLKTKKAAVTLALQEFVQHKRQLGILDLFGTIDYDPDYDYKAERNRPR